MIKIRQLFWTKLAIKELLNNRRFSTFFTLNLALGLAGFIALDSFKVSLDNHLSQNSRAILGADLALTSYLPFKENTLKILEDSFPDNSISSRRTSLFTMVSSQKRSRLVQLIGIEEGYPFYGKMIFKKNGVVTSEKLEKILNLPSQILVYPELLLILGLDVGGIIKIGEKNFKIVDTIIDDPSSSISAFGFAPRIYLNYSEMSETGLLLKKSRVNYQRLYQIPDRADLPRLVVKIQNIIKNFDGTDSKIRALTHRRAGNNLGRLIGYINDYLGLVAMIAVFLAGIGAAYLFRNYLVHRFREISILMSLGATRLQTYRMVMLQLGILGTASAFVAIIISLIILPLLPVLLKQFLPNNFETHLSISSMIFAILLGSVGSLVFCLPVISRIRAVKPLQLFHRKIVQQENFPSFWIQILSYLPLLILSWLLSVWQSNSFITGSLFLSMLLVSVLILGALAWLILSLAGKFSDKLVNPIKRLAFRNLQRNKIGAISCFLSLALGTLLINLIPQIYKGLQEEISRPDNSGIPSLFLFDIQKEQMEPLIKILDSNEISLNYLSPMVRARLEKVNGETFNVNADKDTLTREEERQQNFRRRNLNLSYRTELSDSEEIVKGRKLGKEYDWNFSNPAEVSLEARFAERMGLKIGDLLTFNVQEVLVEAIVINLRRVQWNSFQPNFFILFQPGVLEDAPVTFIGSIGGLGKTSRIRIQNLIVSNFPNISAIDISRTVERVLKISDQMVLALRLMAYLAILAGLVVVFSIARYEVDGRLWELNLLKVLGTRFSDIQKMIQIEFAILGISAGFFGVVLSLIMSYGISWWFFESLWEWTWPTSLLSIAGVTILSIGVAWFATRRTLKNPPLVLLKST